MKIYITFGQNHAHSINGHTLDKDSIACIKCDNYGHGRQIAYDLFGEVFAFSYKEEEIPDILHYFTRGIIEIN